MAFLEAEGDEALTAAEKSLSEILAPRHPGGARFLDAGSGSGLFSAAAARLGASVVSFDYDPDSVECTQQARARWGASKPWTVLQGSLLDPGFMGELGEFDFVYCWGVAHHTGAMWVALDGLAQRVRRGGMLVVSLYNDQGKPSRRWLLVKRLYNRHRWLRPPLILAAFLRLWGIRIVSDSLKLTPLRSWRNYREQYRGMSAWHDLLDWVGGYPFEVARPEEVFYFFVSRGFELRKLKTCAGGTGCNEYVFER